MHQLIFGGKCGKKRQLVPYERMWGSPGTVMMSCYVTRSSLLFILEKIQHLLASILLLLFFPTLLHIIFVLELSDISIDYPSICIGHYLFPCRCKHYVNRPPKVLLQSFDVNGLVPFGWQCLLSCL